MPSSLTLPQCTRSRLTYTVLTLGVPNLYNCLVQIALSRFLATLRQFTVSLPDNRYIQILIPFLPVPGPGSLTPVDPRGTVSVQMPCSDPSVSGSPRYYYRLTQSFVRYNSFLINLLPGPGSLTPVDPRGTVSVQMPCSDPSVSGSPRYYYRLTQSFVRYNSFLINLLPGPGSLTPVDPRGINLINYLVQIRLYLALRRHGFLPSSVGHLSPR